MRSSTTFKKGHKKLGGFGKGDKHTEAAKEKVRLSLLGKKEEQSRNWKGDNAGYVALHIWLRKKLGKASKCNNASCVFKAKRYEWASISRVPKRDLADWVQLCPSCHRKYDIRKISLTELYEK